LPQTLEPLLRGHKFFAGLEPAHLSLIAGCAANEVFPADSFLFREGEPAQTFYLVREGKVAVEIAARGGSSGALVIQTLGEDDVVGFSWLIEPHRWEFDGRAVERVRALRMDGICLRSKCEEDPRLGYELMRRFAGLTADLLAATRLQLLDVYGHAHDR
jgi:CRP/FNR family transcriptional regulator, cyclic AMP receptor protein